MPRLTLIKIDNETSLHPPQLTLHSAFWSSRVLSRNNFHHLSLSPYSKCVSIMGSPERDHIFVVVCNKNPKNQFSATQLHSFAVKVHFLLFFATFSLDMKFLMRAKRHECDGWQKKNFYRLNLARRNFQIIS